MVLEKEDITLECEVAGKPPPRVTWLKNGDRIKQDEYLQFVSGWVAMKLYNLLWELKFSIYYFICCF